MLVSVTFTVNTVTRKGENVCLVGNSQTLGAWNPKNAVQLQAIEPNRWSCCVPLDSNTVYSYRYFVCQKHSTTPSTDNGSDCFENLDIVRWETHKQPRSFETGQKESLSLPDQNFGDVDGIKSEGKGWLTERLCEIHLRLHGNPIKLQKATKDCDKLAAYSVRCSPVDYSHSEPSPDDSDVLVSNLASKDSQPRPQNIHGAAIGDKDFLVFRHRTHDLEHTGFQIEIYNQDRDGGESTHMGSAHLLPENLPESQHALSLPVIGPDARCCGSIKVDILVARPTPGMTFDMETCDLSHRHWKEWSMMTSPDGGHRGMGGSFSVANPHKENTMASFQSAYKCGAKFIETDILVTRDMVPVIYHDFNAITSMENRRDSQSCSTLHVTPIHDLTMEEIRHKKFFTSKGKAINDEDSKPDRDCWPFPTLEDILTQVDHGLTFDLEVKYPQMCVDGKMEAEAKIDTNVYVDTILRVIYQHAKDRQIFFSTFEPDVCILLKLKQSRYPVTFLSQGDTKIYTNFLDFRSATFASAINFAVSEEIAGLVLLTEVLLNDMTIVQEAMSHQLLLFVWGIENNDPEMIGRMRKCLVDGVIYDRVDLHRPENVRKCLEPNDDDDVTDLEGASNCNGNSPTRRKQSPSAEVGGSPRKLHKY